MISLIIYIGAAAGTASMGTMPAARHKEWITLDPTVTSRAAIAIRTDNRAETAIETGIIPHW